MIAREKAEKVRDHLLTMLGDRREVTGVGIVRHGHGYGVRVNLSAPGMRLPSQIDGVPVQTRVTGPVVAHRPAAVSSVNRRAGC